MKTASWNTRLKRRRKRTPVEDPELKGNEWWRKFEDLPENLQEKVINATMTRVFGLAETRGPATSRTLEWLTAERGRRIGENAYQSVALRRLLVTLTEEPTEEPCESGLHEWCLPGAGEDELECFVCGRTAPITERTTIAVLSPAARKCPRMRKRFLRD